MPDGIDGSNRTVSPVEHARAVLLLPFMNTIVVPSLLLAIFRDARLGPAAVGIETALIAVAVPLLAVGFAIVVRAIALFVRRGRGTLAPWNPTATLITDDLYRVSRNPMKAGLFLVLTGEALLFRSPALAIWAAAFIAVNVVYIRCWEEAGLRARFGEEYAAYCRRVPRWFRPGAARRSGCRSPGEADCRPPEHLS